MRKASPQTLLFPVKGVHKSNPHIASQPGTCADAYNVRPYDVHEDRARGGSRPGLGKWNAGQPNGSEAIQHLNSAVRAISYEQFINDQVLLCQTRYATDETSIRLLDTSLNELLPGRFDTGSTGRGIGRDSSGNIYLTAARSNTWTGATGYASFWKLLPDMSVAWTFDSGDDLYESYYDPVNNRVAVVGERSNTWPSATGYAAMWVLDADDGSVLWTYDPGADSGTPTFGGYQGVTADENGDWYACGAVKSTAANTSVGLDADGTVKWNFNCGNSTFWVSDGPADSGWIFLAGVSNNSWTGSGGSTASVWRIDRDAGTVTDSYDIQVSATSRNVSNIERTADGLSMVMTINDTDTVVQKRLISDGSLTWEYDTGEGPLGIAVDSSEGIYVSKNRGNTHTSATITASVLKLTSAGSLALEYDGGESGNEIFAYREAAPASPVEKVVIAVAGGDIFEMTDSIIQSPLSGGTGALSTSLNQIQSVAAFNRIFFVDSTNAKVYNLSSRAVTTWTATSGTLPSNPMLIAFHLGRVWLVERDDRNNWFASAQGDAFNWNASPTTLTKTSAMNGSNDDYGKAADVINCMIPFNDDMLIFGGDHTLEKMVGDPLDGGSIVKVSDQTGIAFGNAWAKDPENRLFFLGIDGVYVMGLGAGGMTTQPQSLTRDRLDSVFRNIDHATKRVIMAWDFLRIGLMVQILDALDPTVANQGWFWDSRKDGWFEDVYPAGFGPACMMPYDGAGADDTAMLFGCHDGYVRKVDPDSTTADDGTDLTSRVRFPPIVGGLDQEIMVSNITPIMAEDSGSVTLNIYTADTAEGVLAETTAKYTKTLSAGRNAIIPKRFRANAIQIELTATGTARWAMEAIKHGPVTVVRARA